MKSFNEVLDWFWDFLEKQQWEEWQKTLVFFLVGYPVAGLMGLCSWIFSKLKKIKDRRGEQ